MDTQEFHSAPKQNRKPVRKSWETDLFVTWLRRILTLEMRSVSQAHIPAPTPKEIPLLLTFVTD